MKKIMKNVLLIIATIALISCKNETPVDYIVVQGVVTNISEGDIKIFSGNGVINIPISVAEDGSFLDTLNVERGSYIISYAKTKIGNIALEKGYDIKFDFDAKDPENTLKFSGIGADVNDYLMAKGKNSESVIGDRRGVFLLDEIDFKAKMNEIKSSNEKLINDFEGISNDYKSKELRNINFEYLSGLGTFERMHAAYSKNPDFKVSDNFLTELDGLDYENEEDFKFSMPYKNLVYQKNAIKVKELMEKDSMGYYIASLNVASTIENQFIKNELLYNNSKRGITYTLKLTELYDVFMANSTNDDHKKEITEIFNKLIKVAKGQPSPKFNYENFKGGTTSLDDLKGKYIYIDVWATWCAPCKAEIPFLQEVEKKYHGKNIEFVSISIDRAKDYDKWRKMVGDLELGGVQLLADNEWKSNFVTEYMIQGIPRFILIDTEGNIVSSNAPRPSSEKLIELFNDLSI